jgi:hypothetical protein
VDSNISSHRQRVILALFGTLLVAAALVSHFSIRDSWSIAQRPDAASSSHTVVIPEDVVLPEGPHRAEFQTSCLICHSARLPLSQPPFTKEKWAEIVHKMVDAYGAPMDKADEPYVVEYLVGAQAQLRVAASE